MYDTIDDPMFALILRFVGYNQEITLRNHDFIQKQLTAIQEYVKKYPPEEKGLRAFEWIKKNAHEYRERWVKEVINRKFSDQKCPDCPLSGSEIHEHCQIHDQWLKLLQQYAADEINVKIYVENALNLLTQHKEDLKIKLSMLEEEIVK